MRRTLALALVAILALLVWLLRSEPDRAHGDRSAPASASRAESGASAELAHESLLVPAEELPAEPDVGSRPESLAPDSIDATPGRSTIAGLVVDERTSEPVPEIAVTVRCGDSEASVMTDGAGRFELDAPSDASGACSIHLADGETTLASFERDPAVDPTPWRLAVAIGPTYPLVCLDNPVAVQTARLVESPRDEDVAGVLAVSTTEITRAPEDAGEVRAWSSRPVRAGPTPWIRYPAMEYEPDRGLKKRIIAVSPDRLGRRYRGTTLDTVGVQPEVGLRLFDARTRVEGHVLGERGLPVAGASVLLAPLLAANARPSTTSVWREIRTGPDGSFAFDEVPVVHWSVFAWTEDGRFGREPVPDFANPPTVFLNLRSNASVFAAGEVLSALPDRASAALVLGIAECAPFGRGWLLPFGDEARLPSMRGHPSILRMLYLGEPAWSKPDSGYFQPPPTFLQGERVPWRIRVVDGPTGESASGAEIFFGPAGELVTERADASSWVLPDSIALEWTVARAGSACVFGNERSFALEDGERVTRATLWPGFGAALYFRAGSPEDEADVAGRRPETLTASIAAALTSPPVPGVTVFADGVEAGTSDEAGAVRLTLDSVPFRLTLVRRYWRLTGLERLTTPGSSALRYVVWLEPDLD